MKLIVFDGEKFDIAPEALLIRPIRQMFEKDRRRDKEEFWRQVSYLWFMCDPRSPYQYMSDEAARSSEVKVQEGFQDDWEPSALLVEAMDIYRRQTETSSSVLLATMHYGVDRMRDMIRLIGDSVNAGDDGMSLDKALTAMTNALNKIPELSQKLYEAEQALAKDYDTSDEARGGANKSMFEDE